LLNQEEEIALISKYNFKSEDINYRAFCNTINQSNKKRNYLNRFRCFKCFFCCIKALPENDLSTDPETHTFKNPEYLGTFRSTNFLEENTMTKIEALLTLLSSYYSKNGIDILSYFHDFDKANSGAVTESQVIINCYSINNFTKIL
jgi:hypothetical protein